MLLKDTELDLGGKSLTFPVVVHLPVAKDSSLAPDSEKLSVELINLSSPDIISFGNDADPDIAVNWAPRKKWAIIFALGFTTFISSLASSMIAPTVKQVLTTFNASDADYLGSFFVSIYLLGSASGPLLVAPLSEFYGRLILYHSTNSLTMIFTIGCALSPNIAALLVFRLLAGVTGSSVTTLGAGTIADMFVQEERGAAMSIWWVLSLIGLNIGPVVGGFLGEVLGWRWAFWAIAIAISVGGIFYIFVMRETYAPVILRKRTQRLRKETRNPYVTFSSSSSMDKDLSPGQLFKHTIIRPVEMIIFAPIVLLASIFIAIVYGLLYLLFTTMPKAYATQYGFSEGIVGLTYLGIGGGMLAGVTIFGFTSDRYLKKKAAENAGKFRLEDRLVPMIPGAFLIPASLFIYGWTTAKDVHWIVPIVGSSLLGLGVNVTFMALQTYIVDSYTLYAASAMAASTLLRSLAGAFLPLAGQRMYDALGLGWGNSLLGFIALSLIPIPFLFIKCGKRLRKVGKFGTSS